MHLDDPAGIRPLLEWPDGSPPDSIAVAAPLLLCYFHAAKQLCTWHLETCEMVQRVSVQHGMLKLTRPSNACPS